MRPLSATTAYDDASVSSSCSALHDLHRTIRASHRSHGLSSTTALSIGGTAMSMGPSSAGAALGESLFNMSTGLTSTLSCQHLDREVATVRRQSRRAEVPGTAPFVASKKGQALNRLSSHRRTQSMVSLDRIDRNPASLEEEEASKDPKRNKAVRRSSLGQAIYPSFVRRCSTEIADAVVSADESLSQLEAFLHSEDLKALNQRSDDISLSSELRRLKNGEDTMRRELDQLQLCGMVAGEGAATPSRMNNSGSSWRIHVSGIDSGEEKEEEEEEDGWIQRPLEQEGGDEQENKENTKRLSIALGEWSSVDLSSGSLFELSLRYEGKTEASCLLLSAFHPSGTSLDTQDISPPPPVEDEDAELLFSSPTSSVTVPSSCLPRNSFSMVSVLTLENEDFESCADDCGDDDNDQRGEERKSYEFSTPSPNDSFTLMSPIGSEVSVISSFKSLMESPFKFGSCVAPSTPISPPAPPMLLRRQDCATKEAVVTKPNENDEDSFFYDAVMKNGVVSLLPPETPPLLLTVTSETPSRDRGGTTPVRSGKNSGGGMVSSLEFLFQGAERLAELLYG